MLEVSAVLTTPDYMEIKWIVSCSNLSFKQKNLFFYNYVYIYIHLFIFIRLVKQHLNKASKNFDSLNDYCLIKIILHIKI